MGLHERALRRHLSIHSACPPRYWVVIFPILRPVRADYRHCMSELLAHRFSIVTSACDA